MTVLVADKFEKSGLEGLRALGTEVIFEPDLKDEALGERIRSSGARVLIVRGTKVSAENMQDSKLGLVVRAGAGYNTIDVAAANELGITVSNCPGKNALAVVELAFGLILACDRHIPDNVAQLRVGKWNKKEFSKAKGLYGRTLGLVGMGNIGQEMIVRAKAFGMTVIACSRWMTVDVASALGIGRADSREELASRSDIISVHVALTPQTKGVLDKKFFAAMRDGAIFINTSRGEVVNQADMLAALDAKDLTAGLDVFEDEPTGGEGEYSGTLRTNSRVYCTHHIGASTDQAQEAVATETVRIVRDFMATGLAPNAVHIRKAAVATHLLNVRYLDHAGVFEDVLEILKRGSANVQETESVALPGGGAIAQIALDGEASISVVDQLKQHACVFDATCLPLGA